MGRAKNIFLLCSILAVAACPGIASGAASSHQARLSVPSSSENIPGAKSYNALFENLVQALLKSSESLKTGAKILMSAVSFPVKKKQAASHFWRAHCLYGPWQSSKHRRCAEKLLRKSK